MTPTNEPRDSPAPTGEKPTRPHTGWGGFWQRITEGLALDELWQQFRTEARAGYGLYSRDVDWEAIRQKSRWKRPLHAARGLFWAMLMKLSPARRVLLLVALVLVVKVLLGIRVVGGPPVTHVLVATLLLVLLLALELADRVTMKRDLEIAREIQHWLVPEKPPQVPGVDIAFATRPANTVAGDYYDAFLRAADSTGADRGRLLLAVADVAGKSVPAALLMATFQASLQALASLPGSLADLLAGLNRYACLRSLGGSRFTTAFLAEFHPPTRHLEYINAGHNAPLLRRVTGSVERLDRGGVPLGIQPGAHYDCGATSLLPGDLLLIFTDGLVEAVSEQGEEFGERRVLDLLDAVPGESAAETLRHLMSSVDAFAGPARQHDDITCLVLRTV